MITRIATDSEWQDTQWVSTQFYSEAHHPILYITDTVQLSAFKTDVEIVQVASPDGLLLDYLKRRELTPQAIELVMFYSPKDLEYALGWEEFERLCLHGIITQQRCLKGEFDLDRFKVKLHDLKGWTSKGLKELAASVGVPMASKTVMDDYKTRMIEGLKERPEDFIKYAVDDARVLLEIDTKFRELVDWLTGDVLGIGQLDRVPHTTGSLVAKALETWISQRSQDDGYQVALAKLGSPKNRRDINKFKRAVDAVDVDTLRTVPLESVAYSQATVKEFANITDSTACFNALVQGGRCVNERPSEYRVEYGADIDLKSCYGSALTEFILPVGLPTTWGYTNTQEAPTLGKFLKSNGAKFEPGLWQIVVSGKLPFHQDLVFSKLTDQKKINRSVHAEDGGRDDNDASHIDGDFCLLRKEIVNGVITSDILEAIKAVSSRVELKGWMGLKVVSACAYRASDRFDNVDDWMGHVLADKGKNENKKGLHGHRKDTRTRGWLSLPLREFIGKLVVTRNELKKAAKGEASLKAKQEALKLFINTTYGVLASPFFSVGNVVVANNITARARLGAWMMNKALHTRQSITDGGMYSLLEVPFFKEGAKLPGFDVLHDNTRWTQDRRYTRFIGLLAGLNWLECITEPNDLDALATAHINSFWSRYSLALPFNIEHKPENTFKKAAYWGKAHYCIEPLEGERFFKIRGAKEYRDEELKTHPTYQLLSNILDGVDVFPEDLDYHHFYLLKVKRWLQGQNSKGYAHLKEARPGDAVVEPRHARYNNQHIFCDTARDYKRFQKRYTRTDFEMFERFASDGISKLHAMMLIDQLS